MDANLDTTCAASVLGMIASGAGGAVSGALLVSSCRSPLAASGYVASNVGNNAFLERTPDQEAQVDQWDSAKDHVTLNIGAHGGGTFADDDAEFHKQGGAPERRLLYGGGKPALMTACVTSILQGMWAVAAAGLSINGAVTTCPPKDVITKSEKPNPFRSYQMPAAKCSADITGTLTGFLLMITYIENAVITCTDTLNLRTICAEAVTGLLSTMSVAASAGAGLFLTCDKKSRGFVDLMKGLQKVAGLMPKTAGKKQAAPEVPKKWKPEFPKGFGDNFGKERDGEEMPGLNNNEEPGVGNLFGRRLVGNLTEEEQVSRFGRRLTGHEQVGYAEAERVLADVKARFATPQEAFASMGFDLNDKGAPYHQHAKKAMADFQRQANDLMASAVQGETGSKASASGDIPETCGGAR